MILAQRAFSINTIGPRMIGDDPYIPELTGVPPDIWGCYMFHRYRHVPV